MSHHLELEVELPGAAAEAWLDRDSLEATVRAERQVVLIRWLGIACAVPAGPFLFHGMQLWQLWGICLAASLYSLAFIKFIIPHRPHWLLKGYLTTVGDTVLAGSVVLLTGGIHSEFYLVYVLIAVLSAIRFGGLRALVSTVVATSTYIAICFYVGAPRDFATLATIAIRMGFAAVTAIFVGFVGDRARAAEKRLEEAAVRAKQALSEATAALTRSLDVSDMLASVAEWAATLAQARRASVEAGPPAEVAEWFWRDNKDRVPRRAEYEAEAGPDGGVYELVIPYGSERIGRLEVALRADDSGVDEVRRSLLETFANRCGTALANAFTYAVVQQQAMVDPTTGLANHRHFMEYVGDLEREAAATRQPLSILMLDLDMFKEFNDNFGHQAGDRALRRVGGILSDCVGTQGIAARYGGDEFVAVMPRLDSAAATAVGQAVLDSFREAIEQRVDGMSSPMGLSIGCATATAGDGDYQTLVGRADLAMYLAKRSGGGMRAFDDLEESDPLRSLVGSIMAQLTKVDITALGDARPRTRSRPRGSRGVTPTRTSEVVRTLLVAIRTKDPALYIHCRNVARLCFRMARRLGLSTWETYDVGLAGLLHDVGKICVPDSILQKPSRLDAEEMAAIRKHSVQGAEILEPVPSLAAVAVAVRHHHENLDGSGYPAGLAGDKIPLPSRIVLVADAYDAITSDRPYRKGRSPAEAIAILRENQGRQFDPRVVATLTTLLTELNAARARCASGLEMSPL